MKKLPTATASTSPSPRSSSLKNMASENSLYNIIAATHNGYYSKQITRKLKQLNLRPALYIPIQKTSSNTQYIPCSYEGSGRRVNKKCLVSEMRTVWRTVKLLWSKESGQ